MGWLLRNWTLKLGALALAMVLYTGLVYSGSFAEDTLRGVPVRPIDQPTTYVNIGAPFQTVDVRYRVAVDQGRLAVDSFAAEVDLSKYDQQHPGEPQLLPITVRALNDNVTILGYTPREVSVTLDTLDTKTVPVVVDRGSVPDGLEIGPPQVTPEEVQVKGASSRIAQVVRAVAHVSIDASGISVEREFDLTPVDVDGQRVESVELTPNSARVSIDVTEVQTSKTLPVRPRIDGSPAVGRQIRSVLARPATVTLQGSPDVLGSVTAVETEPLAIDDLSETKEFRVTLVIPDGTALADGEPEQVRVTVEVEPAAGSRTFVTGVTCRGTSGGDACLPALDQVAVTVSGALGVLDGLSAADLTPFVDVRGLDPGTHSVPASVTLPDGVELVDISPARIDVTIVAPKPSPTPAS